MLCYSGAPSGMLGRTCSPCAPSAALKPHPHTVYGAPDPSPPGRSRISPVGPPYGSKEYFCMRLARSGSAASLQNNPLSSFFATPPRIRPPANPFYHPNPGPIPIPLLPPEWVPPFSRNPVGGGLTGAARSPPARALGGPGDPGVFGRGAGCVSAPAACRDAEARAVRAGWRGLRMGGQALNSGWAVVMWGG